jgi:signal transduction histidine kinase
MATKSKKIRLIFLFYWFLLAYIIAALVWWYIALTRQNNQMTDYKIHRLKTGDANYPQQWKKIQDEKKRKTAQYIGEGSIFFLLISAGAFFVYRAVNKQLMISQQQQNFMMAITHELKTPIAVTKLNLETLQKRKLDDQQQQRLLHNTIQEANRMNALCNNMLLSSQIDAGGYRISPEELNIGELLQETAADFIDRYPNKPIRTDIENAVYISGDKLLLQMAINNLVDNAIKYSPKESPVTITLTREKGLAVLSVKDEGLGIAEYEKKKVFEKYYRAGNDASRKAKGTGLGLYLVNKITEAHQGNIQLNDNLPKGSVFEIRLKELV